jgi:hypothetical protein
MNEPLPSKVGKYPVIREGDTCQKQFNKAFLRILIDRLSTTNGRLSTRSQAILLQ